MIIYDRLWKTMKERKISQYCLITKYKVSSGQLSRLRKNSHVNTHTLDMLCSILNCNIEEIVEFQYDSSQNLEFGITPDLQRPSPMQTTSNDETERC